MTRTMFDSTQASAIPANAQMVAGYCDGAYQWSNEDWARFPDAVKVRIAVNHATNDGSVLDVEPGNWDDAASVAWVKMRRAAGVEPTIYCGNWAPGYTCGELPAIFQAAGEAMPQMWLANYDGQAVIPDGYIAKQFMGANQLGFNADQSIVADYWPGVDTAPAPVPVPIPTPVPVGAEPEADRINQVLQTRFNLARQGITLLDAAFAVDAPTGNGNMPAPPVKQEADPPMPPPVPRAALPSWVPLALAVALVILNEVAVTLHALPQNTAITVALLIVTGIVAVIPQVEAILSQAQAHALRMAMVKRQ